jgi:hypothetical protein
MLVLTFTLALDPAGAQPLRMVSKTPNVNTAHAIP